MENGKMGNGEMGNGEVDRRRSLLLVLL